MGSEGSVEAISTSLAVVMDACVLVPAALCDFLLRAAAAGLYRLCWTNDILDEVQRTLINDLGKQPEQVARRIAAMTRAFPDALVTSHTRLIGSIPVEINAKDRHVVAAAVASGAPLIVTSNLRDFPAAALESLGVEAQSPDEFLMDLFALDADAVQIIVVRQSAALRTPPMTPLEVVEALGRQAATFAANLRHVMRL